MKQSVLEYVREHVHDGWQDRDFSLDEFRTTPMEIPFTDGAMDGICFFHSQQKADPEVCDFLQERMDITDREQMLKYFGEIEEFFSFHDGSVIYDFDEVRKYILDNEDRLDADQLFRLGVHLLRKGENISSVKYGIFLIGLFNEQTWDKVLDDLLLLGVTEEFAVYVNVYIIESLPNCNEIRFELAQKLEGWGKVFLVLSLQNTDERINEWLLAKGADNYISPGYVSVSILNKLDMEKIFSRELKKEEIEGLCRIIEGLLFDAPLHDLNSLISRDELVRGFLDLHRQAGDCGDYYVTLMDLYYWCDSDQEETEFIIATRGELMDILSQEETAQNIMRMLPECDSYTFNKLAEIAILDDQHDYNDILLKRFMEDPCLYSGAIPSLMNGPAASEVRKKLEEPWAYAGISEEEPLPPSYLDLSMLLQELSSYPQMGVQYVATGLGSRFLLLRHFAVDTVKSWLEISPDVSIIEYPDSIYDALTAMRDGDENLDLRLKAARILDGETGEEEENTNRLPS